MATKLNYKQIKGPTTTTAGSALIFDGSNNKWSSDSNAGLLIPSSSTLPSSPANGTLIYNTTTSQLEVYQANAWANVVPPADSTVAHKYKFRVTFSGTTLSTADTAPTGWTVTANSPSAGTVTVNFPSTVGTPMMVSSIGQYATGGTVLQTRANTTLFYVTYDTTNPGSMIVYGITNSAVGAVSGGYAYIVVHF